MCGSGNKANCSRNAASAFASWVSTPGKSTKSKSSFVAGSFQKRSTGTPKDSQCRDKISEAFAVSPSSRHTRTLCSLTSTEETIHLHRAVVLPEPEGPMKTCGRPVPVVAGGA